MRFQRRLMIKSSLLAAVVAASACTTHENTLETAVLKADNATPPLSAGIESADSTVTDTSVLFYIINNSDAEQRVLIWNTPLEQPLSADLFKVVLNDEERPYQGRKIKRGSPSDEHFLSIAAGEQLSNLINIADYYDLSESGTYEISLHPVVVDGTHQFNEQTPVLLVGDSVAVTVQ